MQISASSGGFSGRVDLDPIGCTHDPYKGSLWQHLSAANTGTLRNMFNAFADFLSHLTCP